VGGKGVERYFEYRLSLMAMTRRVKERRRRRRQS